MSVALSVPFAHLRLHLSAQGGQGTWALYPAEDSPAPDRPLVSGLIGGAGNLTADALREAAIQVDVFEDAMAEDAG